MPKRQDAVFIEVPAALNQLVAHVVTERQAVFDRDPNGFVPVPRHIAVRAWFMADILLRVAGFDRAHPDWIKQVHKTHTSFRPFPGEAWEHRLAAIFEHAVELQLPLDARKAVGVIVRNLTAGTPERPSAFDDPELIEDAIDVVEQSLIDRKAHRWKVARSGEYVGKKRGLLRPWGAAQRFAAAFGVKIADETDKKRGLRKRKKLSHACWQRAQPSEQQRPPPPTTWCIRL